MGLQVRCGDASIVDEEVDMSLSLADIIDGSLQVVVRRHATFDWVEVSLCLRPLCV